MKKYTQEDMIDQKISELIMGIVLICMWVFVIWWWYTTKDFIYYPFDTNIFFLCFFVTFIGVMFLSYIHNLIKESLEIQKENEEYYKKMNKNPVGVV